MEHYHHLFDKLIMSTYYTAGDHEFIWEGRTIIVNRSSSPVDACYLWYTILNPQIKWRDMNMQGLRGLLMLMILHTSDSSWTIKHQSLTKTKILMDYIDTTHAQQRIIPKNMEANTVARVVWNGENF